MGIQRCRDVLRTIKPSNLTSERITRLNTVQRDLRAHNLTLNEAVIDLAQNRPLCRLMSIRIWCATHSEWCMPEKKKMSHRRMLILRAARKPMVTMGP